MFKPADLFDLSQTTHAALFDGCEYAWDGLRKLKEYLKGNLRPALHNKCEGTAWIGERVFVGEGTVVEDGDDLAPAGFLAQDVAQVVAHCRSSGWGAQVPHAAG